MHVMVMVVVMVVFYSETYFLSCETSPVLAEGGGGDDEGGVGDACDGYGSVCYYSETYFFPSETSPVLAEGEERRW